MKHTMIHNNVRLICWAWIALSVSACSSTTGSEENMTGVRFQVSNGFSGPVFVVCDPILGIQVDSSGDQVTYKFDDAGVFRVREWSDMELRGERILAIQEDETKLYWAPNASSSGDGYLPVRSWLISQNNSFDRWYPGWINDLGPYLEEHGTAGMVVTPEHKPLLSATFYRSKSKNKQKNILPRNRVVGEVYPRLVVEDGFTGPIYLIFDPFEGHDPIPEKDHDVYPIPSSGVLRVRLTEKMSAGSHWPLAFEESGKQLWLRPLGKTRGFKTLQISAFLVSQTESEIPPYPGNGGLTIPEQLEAMGFAELEWPAADTQARPIPSAILQGRIDRGDH